METLMRYKDMAAESFSDFDWASLTNPKEFDRQRMAMIAVPTIALPLAYYALFGGKRAKTFGPKPDGPEVIIVGGGVVGATMATVLARDCRKVLMVERDFSEPDRIVGELLQPGGLKAMRELGMSECTEGIGGIREYGYVVYYKDKSVHLKYPEDPETNKQDYGMSFHFGPFVQNLRATARKEPNVTCVEATVTDLVYSDNKKEVLGVRYRRKDGEVIEALAPLTIVADGCNSKFRKELVVNAASVTSKFYGIIMEDAPLQYPGHAMVFLVKPYPVVSYQIDEHQTRVLVDVPEGTNVDDAMAYMRETVAPQLPEYIRECFLKAVNPERIKSMPNYYLPAAPLVMPGVFCLGDALNIRHPTTGGGMTVAFKDIVMWRQYLREVPDFRDTDAIMGKLKEFKVARKHSHSFVVNVMANALYKVFSANDERLSVLKDGCFHYFNLGGVCAEGPMTLLSAVETKPLRLLRHFFSVAFYGMYKMVTENGVAAMPVNIVASLFVLKAAWGILLPLVWQEAKYGYVQ